jgi:hypothetical protein
VLWARAEINFRQIFIASCVAASASCRLLQVHGEGKPLLGAALRALLRALCNWPGTLVVQYAYVS